MMETRTNPFGWPQWLWRCAIVPVVVFIVAGVLNTAIGLALVAGALPYGDLGFAGQVTRDRPAWYRVTAVEQDGPAATVGVAPGDWVKRDLQTSLLPPPGQQIALTVERGGEAIQTVAVTRRSTAPVFGPYEKYDFISQLISVALGVVLLVRGRQNRAAVLLGALLILHGVLLLDAPWAPSPEAAFVLASLWWLADVVFPYLWPVFALEVSGGPSSRRQFVLVHVAGLLMAIANAITSLGAFLAPGAAPEFLDQNLLILGPAQVFLNQAFGYAIIAWNYSKNDIQARNRLKIIVLAFVCYMFWAISSYLAVAGWPPAVQVSAVIGFIAPALLTYSVLGQRLFDFGFALNRTLVYATVSFILLAGFGLAEWAAKALVPKAWYEGAPFISAGIALALFLSFHRLRDWVEHHIEQLLFSSWHRNEEALRRFVASAAHYDRSDTLCRAFAGELRRFAGDAEAALYLLDDKGSYRLQAGKLAGAKRDYPAEDRAFALMRAERGPVMLAQAHSDLPGAMALPMLDQGTLAGFALLRGKPDGTAYRPDEVEVLGWAAHQIGLDLQAMQARELRTEVAGLNQTVAALRGRVAQVTEERDRLGTLLSGSAMPRVEEA